MESDGVLVEKCRKGDINSFELLVLKYQRRIFNLIYRLTGDNEIVEDIAQDVFLKAYKSLDSFQGKSSFYTWLYRIAINTSFNHIKSNKENQFKAIESDSGRDTIYDNAENILEQEENPWAAFYLGSSYTYRAVYEGLKSNFWEAFNYGLKGGKILQSIVKSDSTFYDAYLGVGSYEYFWARASRYLFIPNLGGGNVEEAIRKLHVAADSGLYSGPTAKNSLVFVYGEEKIFQEADPIINELLTTYPQGKTFLWSKAELEFKREDYATAVTHYAELFSRYNSVTNKNYANLTQCKLYMGRCYTKLGEKDSARTAFKAVITYKDYSGEYPIIKDYCREAYGMLSRIF